MQVADIILTTEPGLVLGNEVSRVLTPVQLSIRSITRALARIAVVLFVRCHGHRLLFAYYFLLDFALLLHLLLHLGTPNGFIGAVRVDKGIPLEDTDRN